MNVWKTGVHDSPIDVFSKEKDPIMEKVIKWAPVFSIAMREYFSEKDYGEKVKEVLYREFCLKEGYHDKLLYYGPRRKIVDCAIVLDYEEVLKMGDKEYGNYLASLYMERSRQFSELKIKNFDTEEYVLDLEDFFRNRQLL